MEHIDSLQHPQARLIQDLLRPAGRREWGLFLIDDEQNIRQYLQAGRPLRGLFSTDWDSLPPDLRAWDCERYTLSWRTAKKIFEVERSSRTFAVAPLMPPLTPEEVLNAPGDVVVLDQLALAGNAGAIIRTSLALGAAGVILIGDHDLTDRRLIRASRGYLFRLPVAVTERTRFRDSLRQTERILSAACADGHLDVATWASRAGARLILLGSERYGPGEDLLGQATERVRIPMDGRVESLNVSVAAGILLFARLSHHPGSARIGP